MKILQILINLLALVAVLFCSPMLIESHIVEVIANTDKIEYEQKVGLFFLTLWVALAVQVVFFVGMIFLLFGVILGL